MRISESFPDLKHPIQPLADDTHGVTRFKANAIVQYLLEHGPFDLDHIGRLGFSAADQEQFAQLIGYSLSGFSELPYVRIDTYDTAEMAVDELDERNARIAMLEEKLNEVRRLLRDLVPVVFHIDRDDLTE